MPSHYRGIDDESHIWRIDVENESRPSKRQRREIFEKYGIDCNGTDIGSSMNKRKAASFSCSSEEEDSILDASSSLESSSDTMTVEDHCCDDKDHHESSVESILQHYIRSDNDIEFIKEGLDKLLELIGAKKNNNAISKHRHRIEMLDVGGHWMITNLLAALTQRENGYGHGHGHDEYEHNSNMDAMDVATNNNNNNNTVVVECDDDERVVAVVARSCQILRELLSMNQQQEAISSTTSVAKVRYQIYCAGGLDAVVSALKRFPTSFEIQLVGCQCLSHLVSITMINNLYQSTDKLNIIVRLLGCGMRNTLQDHGSNSSDKLFLSKTQSWQLYFVVADIVRSVVKQTSIDSICRSEVIRTVKKYFISGNGNGDDNDNDGGGRHRRNSNEDDSTMAIDECIEDGIHGIGRHMYEHLMTILIDDEQVVSDAGGAAAVISMNE